MDALKLVKPVNSLLLEQQVIQIASHINEEFDGMSKVDFVNLKNDEQFILHVCEIVESIFTEKKIKKRKKELVLKIIQRLIPELTDDEKQMISDKIEFLHSNNVIKHVPKSKVMLNKIISVFKKK